MILAQELSKESGPTVYKKLSSYFAKHTQYNSVVHFVIGLGIGILLTRSFFDPHPLRWGVGLLVIGLLAHLYPLTSKK